MLARDDREAIEGLFSRLEEAERKSGPRDPEAETFIRQKMAAQPAAPYYLAQTVVVQQAALKEAERRIEELEGRGREPVRRGPWDNGPARDDRRQNQSFGQGGGFLAGAAQTALGVAGGLMLGSLIGSIFSGGAANASEAQADNVNDNAPDTDTADTDTGGFDGGDGGGFDGGGDF
ncbi:MAG: DUF2076 domain-containing protein [Devosia nanyangense]|uniref:DUF2076 domain-containing protein n=1 Tax=Devosia nanyangense TaxID=1228055 RepID=A0A933NXS7_9HYPH|nr:DUF2076 domain-containing protein [Devosia nanyangense]